MPVVRELITKFGFEVDNSKISDFNKRVGEAKTRLDGATGNIRQLSQGMVSLGTKLTALASLPIAGIALGSLKAAAGIEQMEVAFETMLGSADRAKAFLDDLLEFTAKTPFELPEVQKNAQLLLGMGFEAENVVSTLTDLGNVASGLGVPLERIALNFGQIRVQGKLTGRELRDFAVSGVPLLAELAKMLNRTEAEIQDMVSRGEIGFDQVNKAFKSMAGEGGKFFNLMAKQSKTLGGLLSTLKDAFRFLGVEIGKTIIDMFRLKERVAALIDFLFRLKSKLSDLSPGMKKTIVLVGGLLAALGPFLIVVGSIAGAILAFDGALLLLTAHIALIAIGIAALIALVGLIIQDFLVWKDGGDSLIGSLLGNFERFRDTFVAIWEAVKTAFAAALTWIVETGKALLMPFIEAIQLMFGGLLEFFGGFFQLLGGLLTGNWEMIREGFTNMLQGLLTVVVGWAKFMIERFLFPFKLAWKIISGIFKAAAGGIVGLFKNRKAIGEALGNIGGAFAEGGEKVATADLASMARPTVTNNAGTSSVQTNVEVNATLPPGSTAQQARELEGLTKTGVQAATTKEARQLINSNPVVE